MKDNKKLFFIVISLIIGFLMLIFVNTAQRNRRLAEIEIAEKTDVSSQDEKPKLEEGKSLLETLHGKKDFFEKLEEVSSESDAGAEAKAKGILEKLQQKQQEAGQEEPLSVRVFRVKKVSYEDTLSVSGDIKSLKEIKMRFEKEGVIDDIFVKEGDILKQGEIIATLNKKDSLLAVARAQSKVKSDRAALRAAGKELELTKILYEKGAIIDTKLEEVKFRVESERAKMWVSGEELKMAKSALEKSDLRAPIDGIIGAREAEVGEFFTPRDIVVNLLGIRDLYAEVGIVERDIHRVSKSQKAQICVDAYQNKKFQGQINNLYPVVEGRSRTMKAEIDIIDNEGILLPGMFAQVDIFLAKFEAALMVPTMSLLQMAPDTIVIPRVLLDEDMSDEQIQKGESFGKIELVEIKEGYAGTDYTQIIGGIKDLDLIVLEAHGDIENGRKVRVLGVEEYGMKE